MTLRHDDRHLRHRLRHWRLHQFASFCIKLHRFALSHDGKSATPNCSGDIGLRAGNEANKDFRTLLLDTEGHSDER